MEATWGWNWAADVIAECGAQLHLAHPLGIAGYENRRVKNDIRDATLLADLLRLGRLPEAWVAPPEVRDLRELVRYRAKLGRLRARLKTQVHQTLGKEGVIPEHDDIFHGHGPRWLDDLHPGDVHLERIESLRELINMYDRQIRHCDAFIHRRLKGHPGYEAVQALRGVGPVLAAVFVAEIGDVTRFDNPRRLCSWAGLTPRLASPTATAIAVTSPNKAAGYCAGPPSRQSLAPCATRRSLRSRPASAPAEAATSDASLRRVISSRSSATAYATAKSAASPTTQRDVGHGHDATRVSA